MKRFYLAIFILIALTLVANYNNFVPMLTQNIEHQNTASSNTIVTLGAEEASATAQIPKNHFLPPLSIMEKIPNHGRSLSLDPSQEVIFLFEDGEIIDILPIISPEELGQESLNDFYTVSLRNPYYLSDTDNIYLPYYVSLSDELSWHGWPEFAGGRKINNNFPNDSLRLETLDAQKLFNFVQKGVSVFVHPENENLSETDLNKRIALPRITSENFLVANLASGEIYAQNNFSTPVPIASISKLITAITAADIIDEFETITMTPRAADTDGITSGIAPGEQHGLGTLYYPLLLNSANDVAEAISEHYGSHRFIEQMNIKAQEVGMKSANFADPSGLSPQNIASPQDLYYLAKYIFENKRFLLELGKQSNHQTDSHIFQSNNPVRSLSNWLGGKNGYTPEAGRTLLSIFDFSNDKQENPILIVVLGSNSHADDTHALLNWLQQALPQSLQ